MIECRYLLEPNRERKRIKGCTRYLKLKGVGTYMAERTVMTHRDLDQRILT